MAPGIQLLVYSAAVHFGVLSGHLWPALFVLILMVTALLFRPLRGGSGGAWSIYLVMLCTIFLVSNLEGHLQLFYLPPILINAAFCVVFGITLLSGSTPIITQFSSIMKGELDEKAIRYTRRVTVAWTWFFGLLALQSFLLAMYAPVIVWSTFTNLVNYVLVGLFFLVEYQIRVRMFEEVEHPGFFQFLADVARLDKRRIQIR